MIYKGILQSRSLYKRILILTACVVLLYLEFVRGQYLYIVLTVLLILAVFHRKGTHCVEGRRRHQIFSLWHDDDQPMDLGSDYGGSA